LDTEETHAIRADEVEQLARRDDGFIGDRSDAIEKEIDPAFPVAFQPHEIEPPVVLIAVWVPDPAHEAIRDLVRARLAAVRSVRQARQQLSGFLLRHSRHYNRPAWTLMHRRWLAGLSFEHAAHYIVLEDCIAAVEAATARRDRLEAHIEAALSDWSLTPVVKALQALRGLALVAAATLVAELGDITRFANPRQFMAYLSLVPSEHSSGSTRRQGGITKAGNGAARRLLIEAAWSYRFPARIGRDLLLCQEKLSKPVRDIAWKAQERLCRRYRKLGHAGKLKTVITIAIARELSGFVWAIAKQTQAASTEGAAVDVVAVRRRSPPNTSRPKLGKAGGTATARRTLVSANSRTYPTLDPRQRKLRDASPVRR
jgi:transposase